MKKRIAIIMCCTVFSTWTALAQDADESPPAGIAPPPESILASAQGTAFTYQGQLRNGNVPVNGTVHLRFTLYDDPAAGVSFGSVIKSPVTATDGLFTVDLDFLANAFNGDARWLAIEVCTDGTCASTTLLSPRQKLNPAPHALALPGLFTQQNATSPNLIGGFNGNAVTAGAVGATVSGGGVVGVSNINSVTDDYGTVSGGVGNRAGDAAGATNDRTHATVGGGLSNTASGNHSTIAGGNSNTANGQRSSVGGGLSNSTSGAFATIAGGRSNLASASYTIVAGGGPSDTTNATTISNTRNRATDEYCTVAGGGNNTAGDNAGTAQDHPYATVSGGEHNIASGDHASIPGGKDNVAAGKFSLAAGIGAQANHDGSFVWNDSTGFTLLTTFGSTAANQFLARATGGVKLSTSASGGGLAISAPAIDATQQVESININLGDSTNTISAGVVGATIAGGGGILDPNGTRVAAPNRVTDVGGTVGGGLLNVAGNDNGDLVDSNSATVAGGLRNAASGWASTVGGGESNVASGSPATIGGGDSNTASGDYAAIGGGSNNTASAAYATIAGGGPTDPFFDPLGTRNRVTDDYGTIGGGGNNQAGDDAGNTSDAAYATVGGGLFNTATGLGATVGGGDTNHANATYATIAGGGPSDLQNFDTTNNRVTDDYGTIGGGGNNQAGNNFGATTDAIYATVGGGEQNWARNDHATIAGGKFNLADSAYSSVGGGQSNEALGGWATIGGGNNNYASETSTTIAGGQNNRAIGVDSAVGGGGFNTASGLNSTVPGGGNNSAGGWESFAAGFRAKVRDSSQSGDFNGDEGTFVWADSTNSDFTSSGPNQFLIRASGGVGIGTNSPMAGTALDVSGLIRSSTGGFKFPDGSVQTSAVGPSLWQSNGSNIYYNAGNVGIGSTAPEWPLVIAKTATPTNSGSGLALGVSSGSYRWMQSYESQPLVLNPIGNNVGIGRTPTTNKLEVEGNASKTASGSWLANSDRRIKKDVQPVSGALDKLNKVRLVSFRYTDDYRKAHPSVEDREYHNVVAQEFAEAFPDYVKSSGEKLANGDEILQVDTYPLTIYSAAAVQELHQLVKQKDREIADLRSKNTEINERLQQIEATLKALALANNGGAR